MKFSLLLLLILLCSLDACNRRPAASGGWTLENKQHAKLSDYKGKVVLLDFYATWCLPCREETPHLVELHKEYAAQGLQVIGLNVGGEDDLERVPEFAKEFGIEYSLASPDDDLAAQYLSDNSNIPQTFVFDRNGQLVKRFVGSSLDTPAQLEQAIKTAVETTR
jgi:thiol-disulfide isomerase/thioredoxin